jgi:hypothetical protein
MLSIGRGGASKTRRLITLISVGWVPPDLHPSGACLALGTRVSCSLLTRPRMTPHRGCASVDGRLKPYGARLRNHKYAALGCHRYLLGNGPHEGDQFPCNSHHDLICVFAACAQLPVPFTQSHLRLPTGVLKRLRYLFQSQLEVAADLRRIPGGPGTFDQGPAGMGVARLGDSSLPTTLTT